MQDLNDKVTGGSLTADEWNEVPSELQNVIEATGQSLSGADLNQLGKGIAAYSGASDWFVDNGSVNNIALIVVGSYKAPAAYRDGLRARFIAGNTNTGAVLVNWPGLGQVALRDQFDVALVAGDIVSGTKYEIYYRASTGHAHLEKASALTNELPRNFIDGLILSNGTDAVHDIDISAGTCKSSANDTDFVLASALGKQIDVAWAEGGTPGAPAGGFPTGITLTNSTWYRVFAIWRPTGQIDAGFDTSANAANLLADATNYTKYRQIGWIRYGVGTILAFFQVGDLFLLDTPAQDVNGATVSATRTNHTLTMPPDTNVVGIINAHFLESGTRYGYILAERQSNLAPGAGANNAKVRGGGAELDMMALRFEIPSSANSRITSRWDSGGGGMEESYTTLGWRDPRGKQ